MIDPVTRWMPSTRTSWLASAETLAPFPPYAPWMKEGLPNVGSPSPRR